MAVLVKGLGDRNVALKKTYAVALGHLVRVAKDSSVVKLLETLESRYLETEDEDSRLACMHTLQAMVRHNPDVVKNHAAKTVPVVFLGKHMFKTPETASLIQSWEELWLDVVPGTEAGLRMYSSDIVDYLEKAITSSSWKLKAQSAAAIGSMAASLKGNLNPVQRNKLLRILLDGLSGRTWEGKEHLLHALASICNGLNDQDLGSVKDEIVSAVLKEAKKEALPYRRHAIQVLGQVAEAFKVDLFSYAYEMINPLFEVKEDQTMEEEDLEDKEQKEQQLLTLELHEAAIVALGRAFPSQPESQGTITSHRNIGLFFYIFFYDKGQHWNLYMELLRAAGANTTRAVQLAIIKSLHQVTERITLNLLADFIREANRIIAPSMDVANYSALRIDALKVLILLLKKVQQLQNPVEASELIECLREVYVLRVEEFLRDSSPEVKSRADEAKRLMMSE